MSPLCMRVDASGVIAVSPMPRPYRKRVLNASRGPAVGPCAPSRQAQYRPSECCRCCKHTAPTCSLREAMVTGRRWSWRATTPTTTRTASGTVGRINRRAPFFWQRPMPRRPLILTTAPSSGADPGWGQQSMSAGLRRRAGRRKPPPKRCRPPRSAPVPLNNRHPRPGGRRIVALDQLEEAAQRRRRPANFSFDPVPG